MQVECTLCFRGKRHCEVLLIGSCQCRARVSGCCVDDTAQLRHFFADFGDQLFGALTVGHIDRKNASIHPLRTKLLDLSLCCGIERPSRSHQRETPRTVCCHPFGGGETESASPARDKVGRVAGKRRRGKSGGFLLRSAGDCEHELAGVFSLGHVVECIVCVGKRISLVWQRLNLSRFGQRANFTQKCAGLLRRSEKDLRHIDCPEALVVPEATEADLGVLVEIAFADLEKAATGCEASEGLHKELARQRVEHDIDTASVCRLHNVVAEFQCSRVEDMLGAHASDKLPFFLRSGGGKDLRPEHFCQLDRCRANSAGRGMDQYLFALSQTADFPQGVKSGEKSNRHCCGGFRGKPCRSLCHAPRVRYRLTGKTARGHCEDAIPRAKILNAGADFGDFARALVAEEKVQIAGGGVDAQRLHRVAEIDSRRVDPYPQFARGQFRGPCRTPEFHARARFPQTHLHARFGGSRDSVQFRKASAAQTRGKTFAGTPCHFGLKAHVCKFRPKLKLAVGVDCAEGGMRQLCLCSAQQSPKRSLEWVGVLSRRHGSGAFCQKEETHGEVTLCGKGAEDGEETNLVRRRKRSLLLEFARAEHDINRRIVTKNFDHLAGRCFRAFAAHDHLTRAVPLLLPIFGVAV